MCVLVCKEGCKGVGGYMKTGWAQLYGAAGKFPQSKPGKPIPVVPTGAVFREHTGILFARMLEPNCGALCNAN